MNEVTKPKSNKIVGERIALNSEASRRVNQWLDVMKEKYSGIRVKRSDLVDWIITSRPDHLNEAEVSQIGGKFYDQMQLAHWVLRQVKEAKASGKSLSVGEIVTRISKGG